MKRFTLALIVAFMALAMYSCNSGPALLTEDEVNKKIEELTDNGIDSLTTVLDEKCRTDFEGLVGVARDSILLAASEEEK